MPLFCPTDPKVFRERCRVPLLLRDDHSAPGWQVWRLYRAVTSTDTDADLLRQLQAALARWLGAGNVDTVEIGAMQRLQADGKGRPLPAPPWPTSGTLARKEDCAIEYAYLDTDAEIVCLVARFVYRGALTSAPWPTDSGFWHTGCPADVVWLLDTAWTPGSWASEVPAPPADSPLSEWFKGAAAESAMNRLLAGAAKTGLVLGLGWLGWRWLANASSPRADLDE